MSLTKQSDSANKKMGFGDHRDVPKIIESTAAKKEKRIQVVFDEDKHSRFKIACMKNGVSMSDVINEFVGSYLKSNE